MDKIERALIIAEAQRHRSRKQNSLFAVAALLVLLLIFLVYLWGSSNSGSTIETSNPSIPSKNEPEATPTPIITNTIAVNSPDHLQAIDEYQDALSGFAKNQRFGEDANQIINELKQLRRQLEIHEFSELKTYYEETLSSSSKFLNEVESFRRQLISDIKRAYKQRNDNSFQEAIDTYDLLGQEANDIAQWRSIVAIAPELFPLLKEAELHRVQNDSGKELAVLKKVRALGFTGENIPQRISKLEQTLLQETLSQRIQHAHELYAGGQFSSARSALNKVLTIDPSNITAKELMSLVNEKLIEKEFEKLYSLATELAASDHWVDARQAFKRAISIRSNHREAMEGLELANSITSLESEMQKLLRNPLHLGDKQVSLYAEKLLQKAKALAIHSSKLMDISKRLQKNLIQMNTPSRVAITSDGKPRIEVRGVGYIEPTTHKIIFLTPGIYELYTHCKGHIVGKSQLEVPVDQSSVEVSVACGRRI